jgi:hypothetical protein
MVDARFWRPAIVFIARGGRVDRIGSTEFHRFTALRDVLPIHVST